MDEAPLLLQPAQHQRYGHPLCYVDCLHDHTNGGNDYGDRLPGSSHLPWSRPSCSRHGRSGSAISPSPLNRLDDEPVQDHAPLPPWIRLLREHVFVPQVDLDPHGDDPGIALITWFISHRDHRTCHNSRMLWIRDEPEMWERDLLETWQDLHQPQQPHQVFLVHPEPPRSSLQFHQAHLLLVQHQQDERSVLISTLVDKHPGPQQLAQAAFAIGCQVNDVQVLRTFRPDPSVTFDNSWIYCNEHFITHEPFQLRSGDSVVVFITAAIGHPQKVLIWSDTGPSSWSMTRTKATSQT